MRRSSRLQTRTGRCGSREAIGNLVAETRRVTLRARPDGPSLVVSRHRGTPGRKELGPRFGVPTKTMRKSIRALVVALAATLILPAAVFAYWPVTNTSSYISRGFSSSHPAEDIATYAGTRVVPLRSGKVVFAGWKNNCGGYQVWISHGNGLYSAYYHLRAEYAWRGELVTGQVTSIGRVGETGCATGPHLHVEVWHGYPWSSGSYRISPWAYIDSGRYEPYRYR